MDVLISSCRGEKGISYGIGIAIMAAPTENFRCRLLKVILAELTVVHGGIVDAICSFYVIIFVHI